MLAGKFHAGLDYRPVRPHDAQRFHPKPPRRVTLISESPSPRPESSVQAFCIQQLTHTHTPPQISVISVTRASSGRTKAETKRHKNPKTVTDPSKAAS
jgi:hypothetical protein